MEHPQDDSWFHERESAWLYRVVAGQEPDPRNRQLFLTLAESAEHQARIWVERMGSEPAFRPTFRARIVATLVRRLGPRQMKGVLIAMKLRGMSVYTTSVAAGGHEMPTSVAEVGKRHRGFGGGNLRAAVFGINDGLVSNASLILGVAGAAGTGDVVLMSGIAGLLAGALSMASGEYVSVRSQREMYEYQIGLERAELEEYPEEEAEELALIYEARGVEIGKARELTRTLIANPKHALDTLAREELGLNPEDLGQPWGAALSSFASFAVGAVLPLLPYLLPVPPAARLQAAIGLTLAALFGIGLTLSLFTGRNALWGALRMTLIGGAAGACTWLAGRLFHTVIG
ncbi:MAG: VIT1/CCC1 transporter family protein [Steroidobacteraceae bacterium]